MKRVNFIKKLNVVKIRETRSEKTSARWNISTEGHRKRIDETAGERNKRDPKAGKRSLIKVHHLKENDEKQRKKILIKRMNFYEVNSKEIEQKRNGKN
jgi:predicted  nucleic acid-binding Zn-ribbon protein